MPEPEPVLLDVRPILAAGGDPYDQILAAADALAPEQRLVIVNSFEPFPLYDVLAGRGFERSVERFPDGEWRITFRRGYEGATDAATLHSER